MATPEKPVVYQRDEYEREHRSYAQPRYAFRKILAWIVPRIPSFRLRMLLYRMIGVDLHPETKFVGADCRIDDMFPELVHVGKGTVISFRSVILAHDDANRKLSPVNIGEHVFIGACAVILPGVRVGNHAIVAAGAVVTRDVPERAVAGGVPAKVIKNS